MSYTWVMGKSYSEDLRHQAVSAVDEGMSKLAASRTFGIARSTLDDWLLLREQTGQLASKPCPGRARLLQDTVEIRAFIERQSQGTLSQMAQAWEQETGQRITAMTFCNTLRRLGYTHKKRVFFIKSATPKSVKSS
jgi:transposase